MDSLHLCIESLLLCNCLFLFTQNTAEVGDCLYVQHTPVSMPLLLYDLGRLALFMLALNTETSPAFV